MSASVLARSYNDTPTGQQPSLLLPSATGSRSRPISVQRPTMSSMKGERVRVGGPSASGTRISFATDTSFNERHLRSRKSSRSSATSLNLRIVQGSERPSKVRVRIPKATTATGMRRPSASQDELLHPRKAVEIARSYGIPKYFLRSNSQQILTDGRMRLFGDSIWKKERTSLELDRQSVDSSDVINRLMESVNRAIETSQKKRASVTENSDDAGIQLEVISLKSGLDDADKERGAETNAQKGADVIRDARPTTTTATTTSSSMNTTSGQTVGGIQNALGVMNSTDSNTERSIDAPSEDPLRPHTVGTMGVSLTGYLPKVTFKETDAIIRSNDSTHSVSVGPPSTGGLRLKQLAAPFRAVSDFTVISEKAKMLEEKYHNVLPRFYPAVSAHSHKQKAEFEKSAQRGKKKLNPHRLVRFSDAHTVRFSADADRKDEDPLAGVVIKRAPVQSIQRALDSHSCLQPLEKSKVKMRETGMKTSVLEDKIEEEHDRSKNAMQET